MIILANYCGLEVFVNIITEWYVSVTYANNVTNFMPKQHPISLCILTCWGTACSFCTIMQNSYIHSLSVISNTLLNDILKQTNKQTLYKV